MRDVKLILQKADLRISSISREQFGPFTPNGLKDGDMIEVEKNTLI